MSVQPAPQFAGATPLGEVRRWLVQQLTKGTHCPCCGQYAKLYKRSINKGMARSLLAMHREAGTGWINVPERIGSRSREEGKLAYWGLVEESPDARDDGGRAGWWRVTELGERFIRGETTVPKHARVYAGRCLGLVGDPVSFADCTATFSLRELMS